MSIEKEKSFDKGSLTIGIAGCVVIALFFLVSSVTIKEGKEPPENSRFKNLNINAHAGWCRLNDCKGMSVDEWLALRDLDLLPAPARCPNSGGGIAAGVATGAAAGVALGVTREVLRDKK